MKDSVLRSKIKDAVKKGDTRYLTGILLVERKLGNKERIQWLEKTIAKLKKGGSW